MSALKPVTTLCIGLEPSILDRVQKSISHLVPTEFRVVASVDEFMALLESNFDDVPPCALVGAGLDGMPVIELAQSLRSVLQQTRIYFVSRAPVDSESQSRTRLNRPDFLKNGFDEVYLLPLDWENFRTTLLEILAQATQVPLFRPVRLVEVHPGDELGFDVFVLLPANGKYIRITESGEAMSESRLEKLKSAEKNSVFVPLQQIDRYYEHVANRLSKQNSPEATKQAVRELLQEVFQCDTEASFDHGKQIMNHAQQIIDRYLSQTPDAGLYLKLKELVGSQSNQCEHLSNVSGIAALLSAATGIGKPQDLAIAGLLHDLGLSYFPTEVLETPLDSLSESIRADYYRHAEYTLALLQQRKVALSDDVKALILQHHERHGGQGYPLQLTEPKLRQDSQLLGFADELEKLTHVELGKPSISLSEATEILIESGKFHPNITNKLKQMIQPQKEAA